MADFRLLPKLVCAALRSRSNQAFYDGISPIYDSVFVSHQVHADTIAGILGDLHQGKEHQTLVLDMGCGTGRLTQAICDKGFRILGLDMSYQSLRVAGKKKMPAALVQANAERLPIADKCLNSVVCLGVWRHFSNQTRVLDEVTRVLLSDGSLIVGYFPPALGGLVHAGQGRFSDLAARLYMGFTSKLGYIDRADSHLEHETATAASKYFNAVERITSGSHWRIILSRFPRNREIRATDRSRKLVF